MKKGILAGLIVLCLALFAGTAAVMVTSDRKGPEIAVPSGADDTATARIAEAGKLLGITLSDHIIIGDCSYYSYREAGYLTE